ncbi:hypothetical protein, partial [Paenibacillus sp. SI8]|uniref:hypothetical protein n=1 Tax=unclassified Paenibacillus TaxID=185978 RepID=UPI0034661693
SNEKQKAKPEGSKPRRAATENASPALNARNGLSAVDSLVQEAVASLVLRGEKRSCIGIHLGDKPFLGSIRGREVWRLPKAKA